MTNTSLIIQNYFSAQLFLALILSIALIPVLRRVGKQIGLVDQPGGRKQHKQAVPLVGGPAILITMAISFYVWGLPDGFQGMVVAVIGLFIIGFLDDKHDISAKIRLFAQTSLIAAALWWDHNWISSIQFSQTYTLQLSWFQYPLTIICILGITNAVNMLDGLDGLSSGIMLIILGFLVSISVISKASDITMVSLCLFGAILGFWAYNYRFSWRERASIFMGDSGTMILGFMLPFLAIKLSNNAPSIAPKSVLLWLFAIPIWDICAVIIKRIRDGKSPLQAGRDHVHHVLLRAGLTVRQTLHLTYLLTISGVSFGVSLNYFGITQVESFAIFFVFMLVYLGRVGSLTKSKAEIYDFETLGDRRNSTYDENSKVIELPKRTGSN